MIFLVILALLYDEHASENHSIFLDVQLPLSILKNDSLFSHTLIIQQDLYFIMNKIAINPLKIYNIIDKQF